MTTVDIQNSLNTAIDIIVNNRIDALALDKTVIGIIDSVVDSIHSVYKVKYDGGYFYATARQEGAIFLKGMPVYIHIPQNDMTKRKEIIGRAYDIQESDQFVTIVTARDNYSRIGKNFITLNKTELENAGVGIRSYHDPVVEQADINTRAHRQQWLYNFSKDSQIYDINIDEFNLYLKDMSALMVEADFRTSLDSTQRYQYNGSYGLALNLVFKNHNFEYGETQKEILDYFASSVKADFVNTQKETISNKTLEDFIKAFESKLSSESLNNLTKDDGFIDEYKWTITALVDAYRTNSPESYLPKEEEIILAYLTLLDSLKTVNYSSVEKLREAYIEWQNKKIGDPAEKIVTYVLDSNSMTGNPFSFSSWSTQYGIFEIDKDNFERIDGIFLYKEGFLSDEDQCEHGLLDSPKEDIFVKNLRMYALKPISSINGDYRLEIELPLGLGFKTGEPDEQLTVQAITTKSVHENLNGNTVLYWFKRNSSITSTDSDGYHEYGGLGWRLFQSEEKGINHDNPLILLGKNNLAYENKYKCVAVIDKTIVLSEEFIVYNLVGVEELQLQSDLGNRFSFDAGNPLITCLTKDPSREEDDFSEKVNDKYQYKWAIKVNNQEVFLTGYADTADSSSILDIMKNQVIKSNLVKDVEFFKGEEQVSSENIAATRIKYPIGNLALQANVTFECFVLKKIENDWKEIGVAELNVQNAGQESVNEYRLVLENAEQIFQYDEYGNAPNATKLKDPLEIKVLIPHLYNPTGLEVPNSNYSVKWILPIEETLITTKFDLIENPAESNIKNIDISKQCSFGIATLYNEEYQNNQIRCQVEYNGQTFITETNFYFTKVGNNGTNGTDMVARILPMSNNPILKKEPLTLYSWNNGNELALNSNLTSSNFNIIVANGVNSTDAWLQVKLYQKNKEVTPNKVYWNIAGNTQKTNNKIGKYLKIISSGEALQWDKSYQTNKGSNYIIRAQVQYNQKDYYAFYNLPIIDYLTASILPTYTRININEKTYLKEIIYNADGRNPVYSHSQGVELVNVPDGYKVTWFAGRDSEEDDCDFFLLKDKDGNERTKSVTTIDNHRIYILPNDEYSGQYTNNRVIAHIYKDINRINETRIAVCYIPIHLTLNTFGLSSLNAWDGTSVTIDEDEGYVLAPQIGAGEKDTNNRFTGILMGKTETYTGGGEKQKQIGLFGYANGLQSIFLDAKTGNAVLGLPDVLTTFDSQGNPISYQYTNTNQKAPDDGYDEGRIELRPGDTSKIGGWKIGRKSLYYTANSDGSYSGNIGKSYYQLDNTDLAAQHHIKDIPHNLQGLLLSAVPAYISIKGRVLNSSDISDSSDTQIEQGDSLELQLDPQNTTMFAIYRHHNNKRSLLSGINTKGQLVANRMEQAPAKSASTRSSLGIESINAFSSSGGYVGLNLEAGQSNTLDTLPFFRVFISKEDVNNKNTEGTIYITGGQFGTGNNRDDYLRPISIHGANIKLYAKDNSSDTTNRQTTQKVKIILDKTEGVYLGDEDGAHLKISNSSSNNASDLKVKSSFTLNGNGNINLNTGDSNNLLSITKGGETKLLGSSGLTLTNTSGTAKFGSGTSLLNLVSNSTSTLNTSKALNIASTSGNWTASSGDIVIKAKQSLSLNINGSTAAGLYLPVTSVNKNSFLVTASPLNITSAGSLTITANSGIIQISNSAAANTFSNGNNSISFTSKIGGFAIQKNNYSNGNAITSGDLGFVGQYGIFNNKYDANNSIYAKHNIYSNWDINADECIVRNNGAYSYLFDANQTINYGAFSVTGGSVGALLQAILKSIDSWKDSVDNALDSIEDDISTLQSNDRQLASDISSLSSTKADISYVNNNFTSDNTFNNHYHKYWQTTGGTYSGVAHVDPKSGSGSSSGSVSLDGENSDTSKPRT